MSDYKHTLNLPSTDFPMKANLANREPDRLKRWAEQDVYQMIRDERAGKPLFILHDGPPYANGPIHLGHALNKTLKDIIVKAKTMNGYDAPYVPGWDCHGLPIELNVEKKVGKAGHKVDAKTFRQHCRDYAKKQIDIQREGFMRLGVLGDWFEPYATMDKSYEANIVRAFAKIVRHGDLRRGERPVHWCFDCQSSLAEAEIEYQDKTSPSLDVRFTATDAAAVATAFDATFSGLIHFPIWTTTPWSLPSNQMIAVHPEVQYVLVQVADEAFVLAEDLLESALARWEMTEFTVLGTCLGQALENLTYQHPFIDRTSMIVLGDHVTVDAGTGCVHSAPDHGADDFSVGQKYGLDLLHLVGTNGVFLEHTPLFAGQHIFKANSLIIDTLEKSGHLLGETDFPHSYPHCWRHKSPVIFRTTPQWFISMDEKDLRANALREIKHVQWIPESGQARIHSMIAQRPDWCISRQRAWGTPIPLFLHKITKELHPNTLEILDKVADAIEKNHIDAWFDSEASDWIDDADDYDMGKDIIEVWFEAGVSHTAVLATRKDLRAPADLYLEGSDQHRGWFHSALLTSTAMYNQAPYAQVLTHGYALDPQGRKMSKSLGNVVAPDQIIKQYGADILRLWVASTDYRDDINYSEESMKRTADTYRRIRNTARFLLSNLCDFDPAEHCLPAENMLALDRWVMDKTKDVQQQIINGYDGYHFHLIIKLIHHFCVDELGSFYLDIIKDRQYTCPKESVARRSAQTAMYVVLEALVRWISPVLSFTADEIWEHMPGTRSGPIFLTEWYADIPGLPAEHRLDQAYWHTIMQVRDAVNAEIENQRKAGTLGSGLEAHVTLYCEPELLDTLQKLGDELRFVLIVSEVDAHFAVERDDVSVKTEVPGLWLKVVPSRHEKCERCWHRRRDVGEHAKHTTLCGRCVTNLEGQGETREFS
ncbi:MAG: isoleucine--tRNA ligase [marine bacterium B5-7]|nr:MAG: isoleucine--tRNA ligase [marine bacterium B5-7]